MEYEICNPVILPSSFGFQRRSTIIPSALRPGPLTIATSTPQSNVANCGLLKIATTVQSRPTYSIGVRHDRDLLAAENH
jgi:hypothetical protein